MTETKVRTPETAELVRLAQEGDREALEAFLRQMQPMIYFLSLKLLGDKDDAEDMTQDVYVKILQGLPSLRDPAAAPAWVRRIVETSCINSWKKARDYAFGDEEQGGLTIDDLVEEATDALPGEYMDMYAKRKIITQMIDELPEKQRNVVYLRYYSELSIEEIAALMEISPGTVKSRLATARAAIKTKVESEERKGNKLYVFFPFLGRMLRQESEEMELPPLPVSEETIAAEAARYAAGADAAATAGEAASAAGKAASGNGGGGTASGAAAAAGKAGTGLGIKVVAGILAVALIGGAAAGLPTILGGREEETPAPTGTVPNLQATALPVPTPTPEPTAEPAPEPTAAMVDFDPEALLGQSLSVLTDQFGEPTERLGDTLCHWYDEDWTYSFMAELFSDGETIRGMSVDMGPAILGVRSGDSAEAAQAALAALERPEGVFSVDGGDGITIYGVYGGEDDLLYDIRCRDGVVVGTSVNLNAAP